ncbi:hypothetical protein MNBD_GAMMA12-67 [hydrothermal vent metagenome]|uniref:DUF4145 domain-containing protein n=1 Tax=hydrothermal vent metagenome TaxID=652676 RepID=A0A3B0YF63_9ZZZZ
MEIKEAKDAISEHVVDLIDQCPHCGARVHIEQLWNDYHQYKNGNVEFYVTFRCKPCRKLLLKTFLFKQNKYSREQNLEIDGWEEKFPQTLDDELNNEEKELIPEEVLSDYQEALKCQSIGAFRASCAMFRRALQSSLVIIGANHKLDLIKQIESLDNLPPDIKDWAHQIRIFGNWGAHPDKDNLKDVNEEDVTETHDFISKLLMYIFIMPEKVKLSRAKREAKLNNDQNPTEE